MISSRLLVRQASDPRRTRERFHASSFRLRHLETHGSDSVVIAAFLARVLRWQPVTSLDQPLVDHSRQGTIERPDIRYRFAAFPCVLNDAVTVTFPTGETQQDVKLHRPQGKESLGSTITIHAHLTSLVHAQHILCTTQVLRQVFFAATISVTDIYDACLARRNAPLNTAGISHFARAG